MELQEPISGDELLFFDRMPAMLPVYEALREKLAAAFPDARVKVGRSQISFSNRHIFAMASLPIRRRKGWPEQCLVVSFGLESRLDSPRVAVAVEPYPRRWTHHVLVERPDQLDEELLGWIGRAWLFALEK